MRRWLLVLAACGGGHAAPATDAPPDQADANLTCQSIGAVGAFYRRAGNPRLVAGHQTFSDGEVDISMSDPDLRWDGAAWQLYYMGAHAMDFQSPVTQVIRHATSADLAQWSIDDAPALAAASDAAAWDHVNTETPSVAFNPDAPADRRYLMLYSGASGALPGYGFPAYSIGAAFSADGVTFTRVAAADSPHGQDGLVLTGMDAYPNAGGAIVADPEVAYVGGTYQLWFSSFACIGTSCSTVADYGIGHATSPDGIHWSVLEAPVRSLLRKLIDPTTGGSQPSVIYDAPHCRWEMWLHSDAPGETDPQPIVFNNMAGVWHATSKDGVLWSIDYTGLRDLAWMQSASGEHLGLLTGADVAANGTARYMLYGGFDDQNIPAGFVLPDRSAQGYEPGVITLNLATRDAPSQ